jgi:hypothetical protein
MINHHEHPNVVMEWYEWPSMDPNKLKEQLALNASQVINKPFTELYLGYRALRNISEGEEIFLDYGRSWTNDWAQYLTHLVHFLELKLKGAEEVDISNLQLPLFRSFINPPKGMLPEHWSISEEDYRDFVEGIESMWDVESWEREAAIAEAHAESAEDGYGDEGEDYGEGEGEGEEDSAGEEL